MVIAIIILSIALARTTYLSYRFYQTNDQLILLNQDIIESYLYISEAFKALSDDNDILLSKVEGLKKERDLYWEDRQSLMDTVKILQGDTNA